MATFVVPTNFTLHHARAALGTSQYFDLSNGQAELILHPGWMHVEPIGLVMMASWGAWCKQNGLTLDVKNLSKSANYIARMKLFEALEIDYTPHIVEHEEAGRFLPLRKIRTREDVRGVIADVSALLHLAGDLEALAAVQYCLSELLRNVLEHSSSPDGAFVCAHNFSGKGPHRVTLAVADCGCGVSAHLGRVYRKAKEDNIAALQLAMSPGVTGALPGMYGTPDNAGAGLFITRCIAKGTGGFFCIYSGNAAYRLRRAKGDEAQAELFTDPFAERADHWPLKAGWQGTVVSMEIRTEMFSEFQDFFAWVRKHIPPRAKTQKKIQFT